MAQMVRVLKATRFLTNGKANIVFVDVVEIDRGEGPELWSRSLRHVGHETSKGKREIGHFSQEILLQKCPTQEMGPSEREREEM